MISNDSKCNNPNECITVTEAMAILVYRDRKCFLAMAKKKGLPLVYLNRRVIRIRRVDFSYWLERRAA